MATYQVNTYNDKATYTATLGDDGSLDIRGLSPESAETIKFSYDRHVKTHGLSPIVALGQAVGAYSYLTEVEGDSVADSS